MSDPAKAYNFSVMTPRFFAIAFIVLAAAAVRLLPHYPNATPVTAMALFSGACLYAGRRKKLSIVAALALPLCAMLLSDVALGALAAAAQGPEGWQMTFHDTLWAVYGSFILVGLMGMALRSHRHQPLWLGGATLAGSLLFFLITNFAVWLGGALYPHDFAGLLACYAAGAAFIEWNGQTYHFLLGQIAGDLFYTAVLFGAFSVAEKVWPALRHEGSAASAA